MVDETKSCPFCAEKIMFAAIKCKHCHSNLTQINIDNFDVDVAKPKVERNKRVKSDIVCPKCNCNEWKLAKIIYQNGLTSINTSTTSTGVGISSNGIGVGVASSNTEGLHQTELSKLAAPPTRKYSSKGESWLWWSAWLFTAIGCFTIFAISEKNDYSFFKMFFIAGLFIFICAFFIGMYVPEKKETVEEDMLLEANYMYEMAEWERKKVCMRCGTLF